MTRKYLKKACEYNKDEENSPKTRNEKNLGKFLIYLYLILIIVRTLLLRPNQVVFGSVI